VWLGEPQDAAAAAKEEERLAREAANGTARREPEPEYDTLLHKGSTTPLMGSAARVGVLVLVAALLVKSRSSRVSADAGDVDGMAYPGEIKIAGIRQSFMGGGSHLDGEQALFTVGLYVSTDSEAKELLVPHTGLGEGSLLQSESFFNTLTDGTLRQTLLLHFPRSVSSDAVAEQLVASAAAATRTGRAQHGEPRLSDFGSAVRDMLQAEVPHGASLFLCCAKGSLQLAYGEPVSFPRTTAVVHKTLPDPALCSALFSAYVGHTSGSPSTKAAVAAGFETRHPLWV